MTAAGRRVRVLATSVVALLLVAGTLFGSDDHFPFGPFRMFATSARPTGAVVVAELEGVTAAGAVVVVEAGHVGLRRAELEGQLRRFEAEPALLGELASAYAAADRSRPELVELRLQHRIRRVRERRLTDDEEIRTVAAWSAT